jgi:hypothetical protein
VAHDLLYLLLLNLKYDILYYNLYISTYCFPWLLLATRDRRWTYSEHGWSEQVQRFNVEGEKKRESNTREEQTNQANQHPRRYGWHLLWLSHWRHTVMMTLVRPIDDRPCSSIIPSTTPIRIKIIRWDSSDDCYCQCATYAKLLL